MDNEELREKVKTLQENIEVAHEDDNVLEWCTDTDWNGFGDTWSVYNGDGENTDRTQIVGGLPNKSTAQLIEQVGRIGDTLAVELLERMDRVAKLEQRVAELEDKSSELEGALDAVTEISEDQGHELILNILAEND